MIKQIKKLLILAMLWMMPALADTSMEPNKFLENLTNDALQIVREHSAEIAKNPELSAQLVAPLLSPHIAFDVMAGYILGHKVWTDATSAQQERFIVAFKELLIRTYSTTILAVIDGKIQYLPLKGDVNKDKVQVSSVVTLEGKIIKLTYRLIRQSNEWKVYDILVENISLVKGFNAQFADILKKTSNIDEIIQLMQDKNGGQ